MPTNAELLDQVKELKAKTKAQEEELAAAKAEIKELRAAGEGWLIVADNPLYDGVTLGVKFARGYAFVQKDRQFETPRPLKGTQLEKFSPEDQKAIREREARPSSLRVIEQFQADFQGYKIIEFDGSDASQQRLKELIDEHTHAHAVALRAAEVAARETLTNSAYPQIVQAVGG